MSRFVSLFAVFLFLVGCGQSGPLYLPGDPSEIRESPQLPVESDNEDDEEDSAGSG
jgi:predicted small lipoprotein YifL